MGPWKLGLIMAQTVLLIFRVAEGKYPNEIVDTPIVTCDPDKIIIKIRTSSSNPSHIYAEDFHDSPKCMVKDQNKIAIAHGDCGMTTEHMDNPAGSMYRICIAVQIHPFFVTDSDRSYCAQCVYMEANVVDDLEQKIAISEMTPSELEPQFDEASNPHCTYSIRKGGIDGPEVHAAVVGETVFHVWQCNNENVGILVQNCHVEDLQGDKILIIDQQGCGVDQYLFRTPQYTADLHTASLESNVFKFVDKSMTRFRCQLRLCVKNRGHGCEAITPPNSCAAPDDENVVGTSTSMSIGEDVDQPKRSPTSHPISSPSIGLSTSGPPSGNVAPPGGVGRYGSVSYDSSRASSSVIVNSVTSGHNGTKSIGPPSIRPYGLSAAHIVSGKTNAAMMLGGRQRNGQPPSATGQPPSPSPPSAVPHQSGYSFRNRRSIMLHGNGTKLFGPIPPHFTTLRQLSKRQATNQSSNATNSSSPVTNLYHPLPSKISAKDNEFPELDVVGLIRVLDNPEDLQYYVDAKKPVSGHRVYVTAETTRPHSSLPTPPQSLPHTLSLPEKESGSGAAAAELGREPIVNVDNTVDQQKCISPSLYWMLIATLALLVTLQCTAVGIFLADRILFDKSITKRMHHLLRF
ncbi:zona pellucida-like domain-containing protein [Ditylenchus destructor]|uniref:Zona pellucida-like domain-containing protein n=1 Tax=Ditylenchus destructor TaxID=166010 RepID=A0AAD4R3H6_9BILA|nr:zona pellucida-like domain-containing protein [Ditylenchus destructor]